MKEFLNTTLPKFSLFIEMKASPLIATLITANVVIVAPVIEIKSVAYILGGLFVIDLITGLLGSYFVWKKTAPKGKYFFRANDSQLPIPEDQKGFSSDKFKKCWIKGIIYGLFPLVVFLFQRVFFIKNFKFPSVTDAEINITIVCLLLFSANEIFSIFWENLPKCGLNIPKGIRDLILGVKEVTKEIKEE